MDTLTGQTIKGYELRDSIGVGGFGVVYRAFQPTVEREVAIKVISPEYANRPEFIRRFENEAQIVARLEHPYIVPLFDFWREPDRALLVMRYYPSSLYDHLQKYGCLPLEAVERILVQIASALAMAHRNGIIHRDLKPENILLDQDGNSYLADFGIAAYLEHEKNMPTTPGFTGSLEYTAPELLRGQPPTVQSDIYSLGYVLHRMLSGKPVIAETSVNHWVNYHLSKPLPPDDNIPAEIFKVLQKATAKSPEARYSSILEFVAAFRAAISGSQVAGESDETVFQSLLNPYKGLRAFEESDADDFFGREALTRHLIERLAEDVKFHRFLAVVGPSGSGKSSVVKAGLVPALRRDQLPGSARWYFAEMSPSGQPFAKLAAALTGVATSPAPDLLMQLQSGREGLRDVLNRILPAEQELFLVIDQLEEVFVLTQTEAEIALFLDSLYTALTAGNSRLHVVVTLRADFYDRPLLYRDFAELMRTRSEVVVPLSANEFEQAIREPAQRARLRVEPQLVAAIISDLRGEPGALPLLQYTLTELFERRDGNVLTLQAYQASGGISQALARRADEIYQQLSKDQQPFVRQVFLRLVTLGEGIEDTRRRVLFSELSAVVADRDVLQSILDAFGKYRLLTFEHDPATREPSIEIAHEALIRAWTQLRKWLEESRSDVRMQRMLATGCQEWINAGRQEGFLLARGRLAQYEEWTSESTVALTQEEQEFLQASLAERDRIAAIEGERLAHEIALEKQARGRLRILVVVLALGVIGALLLSAIAFNESEKARTAQHESDENARRSHDTALLSHSQVALYRDHNADLAITLALEAHQVGSLPQQEYRALSEAVYTPGTRRVFAGHTDWVYRFDLSQDAAQVLSGSKDKTVRLWDVESGALLRTFPADDPDTETVIEGHQSDIIDVVFSPDMRVAASASFDKTARIWDLATGETLHVLEGHPDYVMSVAFSPDGRLLATASETVRLWDVESGALLRTFPVDDPETETIEGHRKRLRSVNFTPDGNALLSTSEDPYVFVWNVETGDVLRQFDLGSNFAFQVALSPDQTRLAIATYNKSIVVWDFETGEQLLVIAGHTASVYQVAFSQDGTMLLTVSQDKSIRQWNAQTGAEIRRFIGHEDRVYDIALLPNGRQFITSSFDGTLRLWDLHLDDFIGAFDGHESTVYHTTFSPDGRRLLSAGGDYTVRLWDVATRELLHTFGPDDPETEAIEGHSALVMKAIFSPDGTRILSTGYDSTLRLWDVETGETLRVFGPDDPATPDVIEGHVTDPDRTDDSVWSLAFSPDGTMIYSAGFDSVGYAILKWDVETGEVLHVYTGHTSGVLDIQVTRDSTHFLTASWDKTIKLWDEATGEVIRTYAGHADWVWDIALSPDEKTFLSAGADKILILWDVATGQEIRRFVGHNDGVLTADFSRDGNWAISGGRENFAILWDVQTGELLRRYVGHTGWIRGIGYSPTEEVFATASGDTTLRLWPVQSFDQLLEWTQENRYVRDLTCPERRLYQVEPYCDES